MFAKIIPALIAADKTAGLLFIHLYVGFLHFIAEKLDTPKDVFMALFGDNIELMKQFMVEHGLVGSHIQTMFFLPAGRKYYLACICNGIKMHAEQAGVSEEEYLRLWRANVVRSLDRKLQSYTEKVIQEQPTN